MQGQVAYFIYKGVPVSFDSISNVLYSFDSGSNTFMFNRDNNLKYNLLSFSSITDARGNTKLQKKRRVSYNIKNVVSFSKKIPIIKVKDDCDKNELVIGMEQFKTRVVYYNNALSIVDYNALISGNLSEYFICLDLIKGVLFQNRYYIKIVEQGKAKKLLLDLGYNGEVLIGKRYIDQKNENSLEDVKVSTLNKADSYIQIVRKKSEIKIQGHSFADIDIVNTDEIPLNLIGVQFFLRFKEVYIDFPNRKLWLSKEQILSNKAEPGIGFEVINDTLVIQYIAHKSKFYKNGFRIGDRIEIVDDRMQRYLIDNRCYINERFKEINSDNIILKLLN